VSGLCGCYSESLTSIGSTAHCLEWSDVEDIIERGVFAGPGVLSNGELKSVGRVPEAEEIIDWLGQSKE